MKTYISFNGKTSSNIIDEELVLCLFDRETDVTVFEKEILRPEQNFHNYYSSSYGSKYTNRLTFNVSFIKCNMQPLTIEEFRKISSWLLSTDEDMKLEFHYDGKQENTYYLGQFKTVTQTIINGINGITCVFENNSPFSYIDKQFSTSSSNELLYMINCDDDEKKYYIYPTITLVANETGVVTIQNQTDNMKINTMNIYLRKNVTTIINCKDCIITDELNSLISYEELGITDVTSLYWLRFLNGQNNLKLTGNFNITIDFTESRKEGVPTCY